MVNRLARALRQVVGLLAMACAAGYLAIYLITFVQHGVFARVATATATSGVWHSGTLYLSAAGTFDNTPRCEITPRGQHGQPPKTLTLPHPKSGRNPDLDGRIVRRWFTGPADVRCDGPVSMSTQPWPIGYWIGEHGWFNLLVPFVGGFGYLILPNDSWPLRLSRRAQRSISRIRSRLVAHRDGTAAGH